MNSRSRKPIRYGFLRSFQRLAVACSIITASTALLWGSMRQAHADESPQNPTQNQTPSEPSPARKPLFDGKSTDGWSNPYEWGKVDVVDGEIHLAGERKF